MTGRIGLVPAFIALTLYALLPIVRNTQVGQLINGKSGAAMRGRFRHLRSQ